MTQRKLWAAAMVMAIAAAAIVAGISNEPVLSAEHSMPPMVVGDVYAFVGLEGGLLSGTLMSAGPYPWVEVKVDNVDANVYYINLDHVERFKHLAK